MTAATLLVDARNVLRSVWPNIPEHRVVELCEQRRTADVGLLAVVFDGSAPGLGVGEHAVADATLVVGTGATSADDWIARAAARHAAEGRRYRLVTSDRELRRRAGGAAERTIGGGAFARELTRGDG